jgi:hypothetical protein
MSFNVKDLSVNLSVEELYSTCTSLTKPTGGDTRADGDWVIQRKGARRNLAILRSQLRQVMTRS